MTDEERRERLSRVRVDACELSIRASNALRNHFGHDVTLDRVDLPRGELVRIVPSMGVRSAREVRDLIDELVRHWDQQKQAATGTVDQIITALERQARGLELMAEADEAVADYFRRVLLRPRPPHPSQDDVDRFWMLHPYVKDREREAKSRRQEAAELRRAVLALQLGYSLVREEVAG